MRFDIRYRTCFKYELVVRESHNELRTCPATDDHQHLVNYRVGVSPAARLLSFTDYWGTRVDAFGVRTPHRHLEVIAEATVETRPRPPFDATAALEELNEPEFVSPHHEYLAVTRHTQWDASIRDLARNAVASSGGEVVATARGIHDAVRRSLRYAKGATDIGIPVAEVLAGGVGVCQDFAHLAVAMGRSLGLPSRYVSGYLFSSNDAALEDTSNPVVQVQTHAWVEFAIPGAGWLSLDPTNGRDVGELHVKVGHGRDYDDVSPIRGVHEGTTAVELEAAVEIRRGDQTSPGSLSSLLETWSDNPGTPLRVSLGTRTPAAMPAIEQEQQQQQQQQQQ